MRLATPIVLGSCACAADLLPGELVLGDELDAIVLDGASGEAFGAAVAWHARHGLLVHAPGAGQVRAYDAQARLVQLWSLPATDVATVAWLGDRGAVMDGHRGLGWLDWDQEAVQWEQGLDGRWLGVGHGSECPDGAIAVAAGMGSRVVCTEDGLLRLDCDDQGCGISLDGVDLAEAPAPGGLDFVDGSPCWGVPQLGQDDHPGEVRCASGAGLAGLEGDHVGTSLAGGRAVGVFNKRTVPARARVLPLGTGAAWALEGARWDSPLTLAAHGGVVAIGVPGHGHGGWNAGRVYLVEGP